MEFPLNAYLDYERPELLSSHLGLRVLAGQEEDAQRAEVGCACALRFPALFRIPEPPYFGHH